MWNEHLHRRHNQSTHRGVPDPETVTILWEIVKVQQSRIRAVEMIYMRDACGVSRWDRESNEDMYRRFGMSESAVGMDCGVVEWVKRSTLRWYGHVMRMNECYFTKKVYESIIEEEE